MNWLMLLPKWQMELPLMNGLMFLLNVADGTATCVTAKRFVCCGRWNSHIVLVDVIPMVADGMATGWNLSMMSRQMLSPCWQMLKPWVITSILVLCC